MFLTLDLHTMVQYEAQEDSTTLVHRKMHQREAQEILLWSFIHLHWVYTHVYQHLKWLDGSKQDALLNGRQAVRWVGKVAIEAVKEALKE